MSPYQVARQLAFLLAARTWPDAVTEIVLGSAHVSNGPTEAALAELRLPCALVGLLDAEADEHEADLLRQRFELRLLVAVAGDAIGERALIGGPRSGGQGRSLGRGLLEVEEEALAAVAQLDQTDGVRLTVARRGDVDVALVPELGYVASRAYRLDAWCTRARYYHPPLRLVAENLGGGTARLTWVLPPARFDRRRVIVRRAAGAVAPATPTAGLDVAVVAAAVTVDVVTGVGVQSFAVFEAYTETGAAADERTSAQEPGTTATVTVT